MADSFSLARFTAGAPFFVIAGPCVIETEDGCDLIARHLVSVTRELGLPAIFKASFDKANRTSGTAFRGPGFEQGLEILERVGRRHGLPLLTDIHHPSQAEDAARVCDILQIPAFLCRQTDLVEAAATAASVVNVKKGQFLSPWDTKNIVGKIKNCQPVETVLTERGTTFGYGNLVVDFRSFPVMKEWADFVVFDATHSLQLPGGAGDRTAGQRRFIPHLSRAAIATGCVDGIFLEIHPEPGKSPSDSENILPLSDLKPLLTELIAIKKALAFKPL